MDPQAEPGNQIEKRFHTVLKPVAICVERKSPDGNRSAPKSSDPFYLSNPHIPPPSRMRSEIPQAAVFAAEEAREADGGSRLAHAKFRNVLSARYFAQHKH